MAGCSVCAILEKEKTTMADDLKRVANEVVEDVFNGLGAEINKQSKGCDKSRERSLFCVMFCPSRYFIFTLIIAFSLPFSVLTTQQFIRCREIINTNFINASFVII